MIFYCIKYLYTWHLTASYTDVIQRECDFLIRSYKLSMNLSMAYLSYIIVNLNSVQNINKM